MFESRHFMFFVLRCGDLLHIPLVSRRDVILRQRHIDQCFIRTMCEMLCIYIVPKRVAFTKSVADTTKPITIGFGLQHCYNYMRYKL